ncbi:TPA: hypothetical protein ACH3X1_014550 [Trebouxia sp. C0004]
MAATLSFNACHTRCTHHLCHRIALFYMKRPFTTAPIDSRSQTWQRPAFTRTLQVQHSVRRLTSHPHEFRQGAQYRHTRTHAAVCSSSTGHACSIKDSTDNAPEQQSQQLDEVGPNISWLAEHLQGQWHKELNRHLGYVLIKPYSNRKVWWSCVQCPEGFPHVWEAYVYNRTKGTGCPFCSGMAVCQHNTLAQKAPEVAVFWDAKKNHPLSPDRVTVSSAMRAHWKCSICLHEWQAPVFRKTASKTGCPKCATANRRTDGTRQKQPTFTFAKHALLEQWDHDRNSENGNFPTNTTLGSHKLIWWRCCACPKGKVHSWQAQAYNRTSDKKAGGCPFCVGQKVCECNSLETVCPDIAADFDNQTNGVSAAQVTSSATIKYSWLSDEPGAKKRSVNQRTTYTRKQLKTVSRRA